VSARELAARRRLLAASATLQRVRLAHDMHALRQYLRPPPWAAWVGVASLATALGVALRLQARTPHQAPPRTTASVWALRGLTLWRAVRALRRLWLAQQSRH
jgi:hypothetical protein